MVLFFNSHGNLFSLPLAKLLFATPICFKLFTHLIRLAFLLALARVGSRIAARIPMMAITTSSSINVKARTLHIRGGIHGVYLSNQVWIIPHGFMFYKDYSPHRHLQKRCASGKTGKGIRFSLRNLVAKLGHNLMCAIAQLLAKRRPSPKSKKD